MGREGTRKEDLLEYLGQSRGPRWSSTKLHRDYHEILRERRTRRAVLSSKKCV